MNLKKGDIVIVSNKYLSYDLLSSDFNFNARFRKHHVVGKVEEIDDDDDFPISMKVLMSDAEFEIGLRHLFKKDELTTLNEAIKRGEMYEI